MECGGRIFRKTNQKLKHMIIPFVNWFTSKRIRQDVSREHYLVDAVRKFTQISREYDDRLHHFETQLDEVQYQSFMDLKSCANRFVLAQEKLEFTNESLSRLIEKK